jgi:hypothetical protein
MYCLCTATARRFRKLQPGQGGGMSCKLLLCAEVSGAKLCVCCVSSL